jgi:parallel beta-helix repeat protein
MRRVNWVVGAVVALAMMFAGMSGVVAQTSGDAGTVAWSIEQLDELLATSAGDDVLVDDMLFKRSTLRNHRDRLAGKPASGDSTDAANPGGTPLWSGGNVYYRFDATVSAIHQEQFLAAANEWMAYANVRFIVRTTQVNFITVRDVPGLNGGTAHVGMIGGDQQVNIGSEAWSRPLILHELGHSLGFIHEHQRSDRDTYVTILTANIAPGQESAFTILPSSVNLGSYDFRSAMHYGERTFSVDGVKNTMVPKPAYATFSRMGAAYQPLSRLDRAGLATAYGPPAVAPTNVVTNTRDSGPGSLRSAIYYASDRAEISPGTSTAVDFRVPATDPGFDGTVVRFRPTAGLPALGSGTTVDGQTQTSFGGNTNPAGPEVLLNGSQLASEDRTAAGISFHGADSTLRNLVVNGFGADGIRMLGSVTTRNVVAGTYVGTDHTGTAAVPNAFSGASMSDGAHGNTVGGTAAADRNVISGNDHYGVALVNAGTSGNRVAGNLIGLNASGAAARPNGWSGVALFAGASTNTVANNTISGNTDDGIIIANAGTDSNVVQGNRIGLNAAGATAVPNGSGGVAVFGGARSNRVGGPDAGQGNAVSGNPSFGVLLSGTGTEQNIVAGNLIGTNAAGTGPVPNTGPGVDIQAGAKSNTVGGSTAGARNVISGNSGAGLRIAGTGTSLNTVAGNYLGLAGNGTAVLANTHDNVQIYAGATDNVLGGTTAGAGNVIAGSGSNGVNIQQAGTSANRVLGNVIGRNAVGDAAGNAGSGVTIFAGATGNRIGGTEAGAGNMIANNGGAGVLIFESSAANAIRGNAIQANDDLGIDLIAGGFSGVTANDPGDADTGANALQNYPVITSAAGGSIGLSFDGAASTTLAIDVFSSPAADPSGHGEGVTFLGSGSLTTDTAGKATGTISVQPAPAGSFVTATATDPAGNTSEFSLAKVATAPARVNADFDGDGDTDISVYRPTTGQWFVQGQSPVSFGTSGDVPVPADYDGNGTTDIAVFRPSVGGWYRSGGPTTFFGLSGDVPVPCDYDGDGDADVAIFRPSVGGWYRDGAPTTFFGLAGDIPVPADYDADGDCDIAVFRPSVGGWYRSGGPTTFFGLSGDVPVPANYDGSPGADIAIYRPSVGGWYHAGGGPAQFLGLATDVPVPGAYAGAGAQRAVFRPSTGAWFVQGQGTVFFGAAGDVALPLAVPVRQVLFP